MNKILKMLIAFAVMGGAAARAELVYSTDFNVDYSNSGSGAFILDGGVSYLAAETWFGSSNGVGIDGTDLTLANTTQNRYRGVGVWLDTTGWKAGTVTVAFDVTDYVAGIDSELIFQTYAANGVDADNTVSLDLHAAQAAEADQATTGTATISLLGTTQNIYANTEYLTFEYNGTDQYIALVFANSNDPSTGTGNKANLDNLTVTTIPEPATIGMLGFGTFVLMTLRKKLYG